MCGIAGIFDLVGESRIDEAAVERMSATLAHRGPDGEGFHVEPGVALAHRRLAIIDLATGIQPVFNEDRSVAIVFNGEIYNYLQLRQELIGLGHVFYTRSDTEVIVHAWEQWGAAGVARLRGMFAFAIFDRNRRALFLARDRLGKKPLYYTVVGGRYFVFASELKGLLAHGGVATEIDPCAVDRYFAFGYVPDPHSIYRNVFKLPPAHHLLVERGKVQRATTEYWRPSFLERPAAESDAAAELIERLTEAVRIRLMSEVPLGAFLSGGVDSSGIVALMAQASNEPVKTFTVGFGATDADDDGRFASIVAERYRTEHHRQDAAVSLDASCAEQAAIFDEPFADPSSVPTLQVSRFTASLVTVALSGDAGDEVFAGYRRYRAHDAAQFVRNLVPAFLRRPIFGAAAAIYPKLDWAPRWLRAKYTFRELALDEIAGYYRLVCKIPDEARRALYSPAMSRATADSHPIDVIAEAAAASGTSDPLARAQYIDLKTYLPGDILTKVDRTSMAASLEVRVPMLDHEFVEWAATLPHHLKLHDGEGKYLLKRALEPYVPRENLYRKKQGFTTPIDAQFRNAAPERYCARILSEPMLDQGLFDPVAIKRLVERHVSGQGNHGQILWSLMMFESFLRAPRLHEVAGTPQEMIC